MKAPRAPRLDERRAPEFSAELVERARAWIPTWGLTDGEHDFGRALLEIAARFNSEVAERLDDAGEKMRRGFLDWLGVRGEAARPARMPVVFKLADTAREGVLASAPVRLQADASGTPVVFETEEGVHLVPGRLDVVVGVDGEADAFYLPPPGLDDLKPLEPLPAEWQLKSFAPSGATVLQLDPESGLAPETILEAAGHQYKIVKVEKDLVTIDPPLIGGLATETAFTRVTSFAPFDGKTRNQQEHALYIGDSELLNLEVSATIDVVGATSLGTGVTWQYWGKAEREDKVEDNDKVGWQELTLAEPKPDAVVLKKLAGAIEPREIAGKNSRWIRCTTSTLPAAADQFTVDALSLRINYTKEKPQCPQVKTAEPEVPGPTAEGMSNNTPLVISQPFFPLGQEPRIFDAFYLGSAEAFSKKGATAQVCLEMSDATCLAYVAVRGGSSRNKVLAGVGKDQALHLFKLNDKGEMLVFRGSLRPTEEGQPKPVNLNMLCRPVIWNGDTSPEDFFVAVSAGAVIWIWHENASDPKSSGWTRHSSVPVPPGSLEEISDIITLKNRPLGPAVVLCGGGFHEFNVNTWERILPLGSFVSLSPIYDTSLAVTETIVAVGQDKTLYEIKKNGNWSKTAIAAGLQVDVAETVLGSSAPVTSVRPAAIDDGTELRVVAVNKARNALVAVKRGFVAGTEELISLGTNVEAIGSEIAMETIGGERQYFVGVKKRSGGAFVASWIPTFVKTNPTVLFESPIPDASAEIRGTPVIVRPYIVVPGARGDAFVAPFDPTQRRKFTKVIGDGVVLPLPGPFGVNDFISVAGKLTTRMESTLPNVSSQSETEIIYVIHVPPALGHVADEPELIGYFETVTNLTGTIVAASSNLKFNPTPSDPTIEVGDTLRVVEVTGMTLGLPSYCKVKAKNAAGSEIEVEPAVALPGTSGFIAYWKPTLFEAKSVPAIEFDPFGDGNWDISMLEQGAIYFPSTSANPIRPARQQATAFGVINGHPTVVALKEPWSTLLPALTAPTNFIVDAVIGVWKHKLSGSSSNPALSWEYWNGKGWWSLELIQDGTQRFAKTGPVEFIVPQDIAESDWAGKTNFWIRARLVGGDYGTEEITVISKPGPNKDETEQVIQRSTANIRAPLILDLHLSYRICKPVLPGFVLTKDSGTIRDQSDANRTPGAIVEAFVPLALTLGRLSKTGASSEQVEQVKDPSDCDCETLEPTKKETNSIAVITAKKEPRITGRELYIGLAATPSETPVNVLLLVEERDHRNFAPLKVEALIADRFVKIVTDDATRALGESGLLSMSFPVPPTRSELFGKENLAWLRLIPKESATDKWSPTLRGAYLNAAWASATETLTRELLGSSDGAPNLVVRLARPPVLRDTLELRVKEPLGEEERKALLDEDANSVLSLVEGLPGDWVLWTQVIDPNDEDESARVYSLDETAGEIRFGDGRHGKIPPIGRDSIVAFTYCRTEPDPTGGDSVPGNTIAARTALNLVSPVESVETVTAADQAAGGAPPESDDRVLRFGFARQRHRSRAVTAYDLEDLALQSSPDIVQAHALVRRGYVRLVVVMRGKNPRPNAAQIRELRRILLEAAPLSLSAPKALRIEPPTIRKLRVELTLLVEALDHTGEVSVSVKQKLAQFFDTATGGLDQDGWALGVNPAESDIALAISDAPYLESIETVVLHEITEDGTERPWVDSTGATEIVMLDDDPVRLNFETAEVLA